MPEPVINLGRVKQELFSHPATLTRIVRDYALERIPQSADELTTLLLAAMDQAPASVTTIPGSQQVFRAAALALASNSRVWASFLARRDHFEATLQEYDPIRVRQSVADRTLTAKDLAKCLPGQTSQRDAAAILAWADNLHGWPQYGEILAEVRTELDAVVGPAEVLPVAAAMIGLGKGCKGVTPLLVKGPGMGPTLASEFLRNLRWSGFKPDRHVRRLLARWFPDLVLAITPRARELSGFLGSKSRDVVEFFLFGLVGVATTPAGMAWSHVDNLVWALGAYREKNGKESTTDYVA